MAQATVRTDIRSGGRSGCAGAGALGTAAMGAGGSGSCGAPRSWPSAPREAMVSTVVRHTDATRTGPRRRLGMGPPGEDSEVDSTQCAL